MSNTNNDDPNPFGCALMILAFFLGISLVIYVLRH